MKFGKNIAGYLLDKGQIVYVYHDTLNTGEMLKIYPDKRQEIVTLDKNYKEVLLRVGNINLDKYFEKVND